MTTPAEPTYPYCVTITKPGHDTVHLGFTHKFEAETAGLSLRNQLRHTVHPEGTTIDWGPTPDDTHVHPPVPTNPHLLAEQIAKATSGDDPGSNFPDLYSRLRAQETERDCKAAWTLALDLLLDEDPDTVPAVTPPFVIDKQRRELQHRHGLAASSVSSVGMWLGQWAGQGDWSSLSATARDKAGQDALSRLDEGLAEVQRVRAQIAVALGHQTTVEDVDEAQQGVTAGYNPDTNAWHVEVHRTGHPVEIIPIVAPQTADQETARTLAEQIADNLEYRHIEHNQGLSPATKVLDQIRTAAWMTGEDDPALLEEIVRLRAFEQAADQLGWTRVTTDPQVAIEFNDLITYARCGMTVSAAPGQVRASTPDIDLTNCSPKVARTLGAMLIEAAKHAEDLQRARDIETTNEAVRAESAARPAGE